MQTTLFSSKPPATHMLAALPIEILYVANPDDWEPDQTGPVGNPTFKWWDLEQGVNRQYADAYAMRTAFEMVKTPTEAGEFLAKCGPFRVDAFTVSWTKFQEWQEYFVRQLKPSGYGAPPEHNDDGALHRIIGWHDIRILRKRNEEHISIVVQCQSAVEAIAATIYVDKLRGITTKSCPWCKRSFQPQTARAVCCSHACSHSYSSKRRRENLSKEKAHAATNR